MNSVFENVDKNTCKLYVPTGSSSLYLAATAWSDFANIIEEEVTAVTETKKNDIAVYAQQRDIVVKGAGVGETIFVYTTLGMLVKTTKAISEVRIPVSSNQVYLVRFGSKTFKIAIP